MDMAYRGTLRAQLTKITNNAQEYLSSAESRTDDSNASNFELIAEESAVFLQRITAVRENLSRANEQLRSSIKPEDNQRECDAIVDYEDKAVSLLSRLQQRLDRVNRKLGNERETAVQGTPASARGNQVTTAKLPKLALKSFSGNFRDWLPFWERFRTAVHEQPQLSGADKFNYLQHHLTGIAAESIAGFVPSDENYFAAISMLQEEFGDKEKLIDHTMQQLMALPTVSSRRDISGLRKLYNDVTTHTRSLTVLGVPATKYSIMLRTLLLTRMPRELVTDLHRCCQLASSNSDSSYAAESTIEPQESDPATDKDSSVLSICGDSQLRNIMKFLKREVESLERATLTQTERTPTAHQKMVKSAAGLMSSSEAPKCIFCQSKSHHSRDCSQQMPIHKRKETLKREGRCFKCLQKGHNSRKCWQKTLKCAKCNGRHSTCMCDPDYRPSSSTSSQEAKPKSGEIVKPASTANLCSVNCQESAVFLQTVRALIVHPSINSKLAPVIRIILDGGSQRSYIKESLVKKLGIEIFDSVNLRILPFGSQQRTTPKSFKRVKIVLKSIYDENAISILAVVVPNICVDILPVPSNSCELLSGVLLADNANFITYEEGLGVLIGADFYWSITCDENKRLTNEMVATRTIFGWAIQGPAPNYNNECFTLCTAAEVDSFEEGEFDLKRFWDLESLGITNKRNSEPSNDFEKSIQKIDDRYEASLLWRDSNSVLDSNKQGAMVRFESLLRKLMRVPANLLEYDAVMWEMITSGIAERALDKEDGSSRKYYMPHRPVYRHDKTTTKVRIVFDASAHAGDALSLNRNLHQGPNLLPEILAMLLNFRTGAIGVVADIEKAFLQIRLNEKDRDAHRFFWFEKQLDDAHQLPARVEYRMTRVTFGVTCSPYILCATLRKHFNSMYEIFPDTCQMLLRSFYMDDLVTSLNDAESGQRLYLETRQIMKEAQMNIRKWNSSDSKLRKVFNENCLPQSSQKVLGIIWSCENDELKVDLENVLEKTSVNPTKRNVSSLMARIYDPLGILGPFTVGLKILIQQIWKLQLDWDEPLPPNLQTSWNKVLRQVEPLKEISVPRYMFSERNIISAQLHLFADASPRAYGAVAYIRSINNDGSAHVVYLCSKNRVAPLKTNTEDELTLPKLELTAALIASRLAKYIRDNIHLKFDDEYLWTDSQIVMAWLRNDKQRYMPYTQNRVEEIRLLTHPDNWHHCPGPFNPADNLTRGLTGKQSAIFSSWLTGPAWLAQHTDNWPTFEYSREPSKVFLCLQVASEDKNCGDNALFCIEKFSSYRRIMRITAYVLRYVNILRKGKTVKGHLTGNEIRAAEVYWIKYIQYLYFPDEVDRLKKGDRLRGSSSILTLHPILDQHGVMRNGTRLQESHYEFDEIYPIILPKSSYFSTLLVKYTHERALHSGVNATLTSLRRKFWIIKSRQLVKGIIGQCILCRRFRSAPASQPPAPLPGDRLHASRAFETTGIDFAGPLYGKLFKADQETKKFYIMILTCAVIRAVHLELVPNLSTEECINALRRFFARRGIPRRILSDNAKTFKRASIELQPFGKIIESSSIQDFATNEGIQWDFIVERAAWWGGFWERLVKVIKDVLKITIGKLILTRDQLETFLCETEAVVNARPLTYVSEDPEDLSPLTPNSFLSVSLPTDAAKDKQDGVLQVDATLRDAWKSRLKLINKFTKRFKTEYVQRLRSAHHQRPEVSSALKVGDIVLVYDQLVSRTFWKLARVLDVFPGRDGRIRSCEIRFPNGFTTRRAVQHLYPLEANI